MKFLGGNLGMYNILFLGVKWRGPDLLVNKTKFVASDIGVCCWLSNISWFKSSSLKSTKLSWWSRAAREKDVMKVFE